MVTPGEHVEFHGGIAYHVETRVLRQTPLADLITHLAIPPAWTTPVLPWGTKLFHQDPASRRVDIVIEDPFATKTFSTTGLQQPLRLMMPNTIFVFGATKSIHDENEWHLGDVYAFWSKDPITGWDSPVIDVRLPNVYDTGRICFGSTATPAEYPLHQRINATVNNFYRSDFNRDLGWRKPNDYRSYAQWASATRVGPMGWRTWSDWNDARPLNDRVRTGRAAAPIQLTGDIPDYAPTNSFGRAEQWFEALPPVARYRLVTAIRAALPRVGMEAEDTGLEYEADDLRALQSSDVQAPRGASTGLADEDQVPIPEDDVNFAGVRGRPSDQPAQEQPCPCDQCVCPNHAEPDGDYCLSCQNGEHPGDPR